MLPIIVAWLISAGFSESPGAGPAEIRAIALVAALPVTLGWLAILTPLLLLARLRHDLMQPQALLLAGAVCLLGAVSPLLFIVSIWLPVSSIAIPAEAAHGFVLVLAAIIVWRFLPRTLTLPSRSDLRAANARLEAEIRERVAVQAALGALNAELEERVALRTAELTRTNYELLAEIAEKHDLTIELARARDLAEDANRVKSMFLAAMSHDLRTPLNAIIGFSDMILQEVRGPIGHARYRSYIDDIHCSGQLLLNLINNILDLSKIEAGKHELVPVLVDGQKTAQECFALIAGQAGFAEIDLSIAVEGGGQVFADELALRQILMNLVGNAAKFTPPQGRIVVKVARIADGGALVSVIDTGIGMDAPGIRKALEPFGQADMTARPPGSGSGLGLTIVSRLVEAHGGRLTIDSMPGAGTTIRVWFPGPPDERIPDPVPQHRLERWASATYQDLEVR